MFTTGSKLLIGSAAAAALFAVAYGVAQGGTLGTIGLVSAAVGLSLLAAINVFVRDSNVSATDEASFEMSAAAQATTRDSLWPLLMGVGVTTLTLGLVTYRAIFVLGVIAMIAAAVEWLIQGWSERASADAGYNAEARHQLADPLEIPVAAAIGAGIIVYAVSRIMLGVSTKTATVVAFAVLAALVLVVGTVLSTRRGTSKAVLTGTFSIVAIALVAGGAVAGINGERETHEHENTSELAETNRCTEEETEADHDASQTVAVKANVTSEITFDGALLTSNVPEYDGDFSALTITRSNPTNILFYNQSDDDVRLVIDLHPPEGSDGPERVCTALVGPTGVQLLTFQIDQPSFAVEEGFAFTVPGSDAELEVVVP